MLIDFHQTIKTFLEIQLLGILFENCQVNVIQYWNLFPSSRITFIIIKDLYAMTRRLPLNCWEELSPYSKSKEWTLLVDFFSSLFCTFIICRYQKLHKMISVYSLLKRATLQSRNYVVMHVWICLLLCGWSWL